ncbi:site-specific integrase [Flavilitoribacter nigricans]|uniref:Uncharacterized protein n=1 Tax=Flavilitoribacter nigricans (strain ATCC 23147 / DSM 23189 / NBRC 102662 / NCIMB 1420 / SS-2) TaxID=1122177 RepID=A0A2D0MXZ4_FLAN2|nr:site-specific integrase [Flavilitoribacter nigricans]PHN01151.1 hypothetical protein CRP01_38760 [Flavilitoribacter nigricans DSM 23189 = NBRC 102662]
MASVKLYFDIRRAKSDETYPLKLKVFHKNLARYIPLNFFFKKNQWHVRDHKVNSSYPNSGRVNAQIRNLLSIATNYLAEQELLIRKLSIDELKQNLINEMFKTDDEADLGNQHEFTLAHFANSIIERQLKSGKVGTAQTYKTCLKAIFRFSNENLLLKDINHRFLADFEADCLARGIKVNSISVYLRTLRAIMNKAIDEGILPQEQYPFRKFKIKQEKTQKRAISKEEIKKIIDIELPNGSRIWHSRNYFVFMFNMKGMNFIDVAYLTVQNIQKDRIVYKRIKTGKLYNIKITSKAQEVLSYYLGSKKHKPADYVFPILTKDDSVDMETERKRFKDKRKKLNQDLKKIGDLCGIETNLTSYVSRHTWASIAKFSGVAPAIIGESLGHSDLKTTETYLAHFDHDVLDDANDLIVG